MKTSRLLFRKSSSMILLIKSSIFILAVSACILVGGVIQKELSNQAIKDFDLVRIRTTGNFIPEDAGIAIARESTHTSDRSYLFGVGTAFFALFFLDFLCGRLFPDK